ncbi:hypothetical protein ACFFRR_004512 [Megaselia abdita]
MVLMRTYCFYFSVRLGVILASSLVIIQLLITITLFHLFGRDWLNQFKELIDTDESEFESLVKSLTIFIENPNDFLVVFNIAASTHFLNCFIAMYGAFKLQKWFMIPFIFFEFIRFGLVLTSHIVLMLVLKRFINLGELIAATLAGSCLIFFIGYNWSTAIALFQIINLVKSEKYQSLYGSDPLCPIEQESSDKLNSTPNVKMIYTPEYDVILKKVNNREHKIVPVLPAYNEIAMENYKNWFHKELIAAHERKGRGVGGLERKF